MNLITDNKGFTLVELLLALSIFAAVISTLFLTFSTIVSNVNPMKNGLDNYEAAANTMRRLTTDLKAICLTHRPAYFPPDNDDNIKPDRFRFLSSPGFVSDGTFASLRFASFEHLPMDTDDTDRIGIITYFAAKAPDGSIILRRKDTALSLYNEKNNEVAAPVPIVCEKVKSFELEFIDQDGEPRKSWDSDSADVEFSTPLAVRIKLEIGGTESIETFACTVYLPTSREKQ